MLFILLLFIAVVIVVWFPREKRGKVLKVGNGTWKRKRNAQRNLDDIKNGISKRCRDKFDKIT